MSGHVRVSAWSDRGDHAWLCEYCGQHWPCAAFVYESNPTSTGSADQRPHEPVEPARTRP